MSAALDFPSEPLVDDLVLLRPWSEDDVRDGIMAFSDATVQRFSWPRATAYTEVDACEFFAEQLQARLRGEEVNFALADPAAHESVFGGASLYGVDFNNSTPQWAIG